MRLGKSLIKWPRNTTSYGTDSSSLIKLIKLVAQTLGPFGHSSNSKLGNFPSSQQQTVGSEGEKKRTALATLGS